MSTDSQTDEFEVELARFLERGFEEARDEGAVDSAEDDAFARVRVLKSSPHEVTELVCGKDPLTGAYRNLVRKTIDAHSGIGSAYELLYHAQQEGLALDAVPNIVLCENDGRELRVVMDYVEGESLVDFVAHRGAGSDTARLIFAPLCDTVERLHSGIISADGVAAPLIHRDLKPSNIIVNGADVTDNAGDRSHAMEARPQITLIDFGIARSWREGATSDTVKFGTRSYAPPEQFGFGQTDARSDVYALGAVLYFCLAGTDPEPGKKISEQVARQHLPESLAAVVMRAMALDPDERYANVRDLHTAFKRAMANVRPSVLTRLTGASSVGRKSAAEGGDGECKCDSAAHSGALSSENRSTIRKPLLAHGERENQHAAQDDRPQSFARAALGMAWNLVVAIAFMFVVAGSTSAILEPTEANSRLSPWYLVLEYGVFIDIAATLVALCLLDKSRLRAYAPILDSARGWRYIVRALVLMVALYAIVMAVGLAAGEIQKL